MVEARDLDTVVVDRQAVRPSAVSKSDLSDK
jgi:hypothetical protein